MNDVVWLVEGIEIEDPVGRKGREEKGGIMDKRE
jgi:hypothetical protein